MNCFNFQILNMHFSFSMHVIWVGNAKKRESFTRFWNSILFIRSIYFLFVLRWIRVFLLKRDCVTDQRRLWDLQGVRNYRNDLHMANEKHDVPSEVCSGCCLLPIVFNLLPSSCDQHCYDTWAFAFMFFRFCLRVVFGGTENIFRKILYLSLQK